MEKYDLVVSGGGIAGSIAARVAARNGLKTLLVERYKTPRNKPCSGIQFPYFEKLIGQRIPREKLCKNELSKVVMITPQNKVMKGRMKMLNFWRSTFDSWLNTLAIKDNVEFQDETSLVNFNRDQKGFKVKVSSSNEQKLVRTNYLIGADGMLSSVRRKLRPQDFKQKSLGTAVNYYFKGEGNLDPNTLYMFYDRDFCTLMFAWAYLKDDHWVIGTGANQKPMEYAERFFNHVKAKYDLRGRITKKEGFASTQNITVYLGAGNVLLAGDAAGLIDLYRGVGMDTAALSGRLAAKSILEAEEGGPLAIEVYQELMKKRIKKLEKNADKQVARYASNKTLESSLSGWNLLKGGLTMIVANQLNKILPTESLILLPT